jgi:HlyD family secretion protein
VPVSAVFPVRQGDGGTTGGMAVFAVENGRARQMAVEIGARNGAEAWVQKGLQPGAVVIVYPQAAVRDGAAVKIRKV